LKGLAVKVHATLPVGADQQVPALHAPALFGLGLNRHEGRLAAQAQAQVAAVLQFRGCVARVVRRKRKRTFMV